MKLTIYLNHYLDLEKIQKNYYYLKDRYFYGQVKDYYISFKIVSIFDACYDQNINIVNVHENTQACLLKAI